MVDERGKAVEVTHGKPVTLGEQEVEPGWIDYNGHMNVAYYLVAFDRGLDELFEALGIGESFVAEARMGPFALQTHLHFLSELALGARFVTRFRLLDVDAKRVHLFCEMLASEDGRLCATLEQVTMNVDLTTRRSAPYPDWARARLETLRKAHADLPRAQQIGAALGLRSKRSD
ncbi:MAG: thioesterase family protein [Pseudomonadota bacterium]